MDCLWAVPAGYAAAGPSSRGVSVESAGPPEGNARWCSRILGSVTPRCIPTVTALYIPTSQSFHPSIEIWSLRGFSLDPGIASRWSDSRSATFSSFILPRIFELFFLLFNVWFSSGMGFFSCSVQSWTQAKRLEFFLTGTNFFYFYQ